MNKNFNIKFWKPNKEIINGLTRAIDRIEEQDRTIKTLREKLRGKKEILKDELMVDYHQMEETKDRYVKFYNQAPFHFTEEELRDYNDFRDNHQSSIETPDEEGNQICDHADGFRMPITFYWTPNMSYHKIIVECPYCHTKRELGSWKDILAECDSPKNAED